MNFWSTQAWDYAVGRAWPLLDPRQPQDGERVRAALHSYWSQRLERVPPSILSAHARGIMAAHNGEHSDTMLAGGFEIVHSASRFAPEALWFFDVGCAAWSATLQSTSFSDIMELDEVEQGTLARIEKAWRTLGSTEALSEIERCVQEGDTAGGVLYLYATPLVLWQERNLARAFDYFDRARDLLPNALLEALGVSESLTYAMMLALDGNLEAAINRLDPSRHPNQAHLALGESRYHRARYLWAMGSRNEATSTLLSLIEDEPAYLLRFATDIAWGRHPEGARGVYAAIDERAEKLKTELMRWQRQVDLSWDETFAGVKAAMEAFSSDAYPIFAANAARRRALARGGIEPYDPPSRFYTEVDRLQEFAEEFPVTLPFRTGPYVPARFAGSDDSEMERLMAVMDEGVNKELVDYVGELVEALPRAVRFGILEHGQRLVNALIAEHDMLLESDERRTTQLRQWAQRCVDLIPSVNALAQHAVSKDFAKRVHEVWSELYRVESEWISYRKGRHGQAELVVPNEEQVIEAGDWRAIVCKATDVKGNPLPAMPVVWKVASGPALPKEGVQFMIYEWSQSLRSGAAYIRIMLPEDAVPGASGEIEARALSGSKWYRIKYRVADA